MELKEAPQHAHSFGQSTSGQYFINPSAKLMELLSKNLYSDPILAPVRELSTNAWDSHICAGTTNLVPEIHLPTTDNPIFKIRDFGTGISFDKMDSVYRGYGVSDKTSGVSSVLIAINDKLNGCMGLGSKSPFAYTTAFTTISWHGGTKYVWVNGKDSQGYPTLNLFHQEDSKEPSGIEISFTVRPADFDRFKKAVISVMRWFSVRFNIFQDGQQIDINNEIDYKHKLKGKDWVILDEENQSFMVMGNVAYPIDPSKLGDDPTQYVSWYSYNSNKYITAINAHIRFECGPGEVDFDVSREKLFYSDKTIATIKRKIDEFYTDFEQTLVGYVSSLSSEWKKRIAIDTFCSGNTLSKLVEKINLGTLTVEKETKVSQKPRRYNRHNGRSIEHATKISATKNTRVYIHDVPGRIAEVKELVSNNPDITVYLVDESIKKEFILEQGLEASDLLFVSSLPKLPKTSRGGGSRKKGKIFKYNNPFNLSHKKNSDYWIEVQDDEDLDGLFVKITNNWEVNYFEPQRYFNDRLKNLKEICTVPTIYGIKEKFLGEDDFSDLESFEDFAKNQIITWWTNNLENIQKHVNYTYVHGCSMLCRLAKLNTLIDDVLIFQLDYQDKCEYNAKYGVYSRLVQVFNINGTCPTPNVDKTFQVYYDKFEKEYKDYRYLDYEVFEKVINVMHFAKGVQF